MALSTQQLIHSNHWRYRVARHGLFWLIYFIGYSFVGLNESEQSFTGLALAIRWFPFCALNTYVIMYWLVERYLLRSKYRAFFCFLAAWTAVSIFLSFLTHLYLAYPYCWDPGPRPSFRQALPAIFDIYPIFVNYVVTGFAVFLRMYKFWRVELVQKLQLKKERTDAELELLKAQLHPHFLFNTLNNLYTLILEKSYRAPEMLLRLSAILNYVLNECEQAEVPLEKEIAFCEDYIDLEKERYGDRLDINTRFCGDIQDKMITPMVFQPFIENAFKHGAAKQLGKVWIDIGMTIHDNRLSFQVSNSADFSAYAICSGGIGVANIKRRLQLLYPGRHQFVEKREQGMHSISLNIDLAPPSRDRVYRAKKSLARPRIEQVPDYSL
jgi:two-component system LytT family sensor kinase